MILNVIKGEVLNIIITLTIVYYKTPTKYTSLFGTFILLAVHADSVSLLFYCVFCRDMMKKN